MRILQRSRDGGGGSDATRKRLLSTHPFCPRNFFRCYAVRLTAAALLPFATVADTLNYQWDAVDGGTAYARLYELQWRSNASAWQSVGPVAQETAQVLTPPLQAGQTVEARVRAFLDDDGVEKATSDWSEAHFFVKPPEAPTGVIVISVVVQIQRSP